MNFGVEVTNTPPIEAEAENTLSLLNDPFSVVGQYHPVNAENTVNLLSRYPNTKLANAQTTSTLGNKVFDPVKIGADDTTTSDLLRITNVSVRPVTLGLTDGRSLVLGPGSIEFVQRTSVNDSQVSRLIELEIIQVIGANLRKL